MLQAYFDESYDHKKRLYVLSGFVAPETTWVPIAKRWAAILKKFGIKKEYKADDCFQGNAEFKGKGHQRDQIAKQLVKVLTHPSLITKPKAQRTDLYGVSFAISWDDFDEVMPAHGYPHPHAYLFQRMVRLVSHWTYVGPLRPPCSPFKKANRADSSSRTFLLWPYRSLSFWDDRSS